MATVDAPLYLEPAIGTPAALHIDGAMVHRFARAGVGEWHEDGVAPVWVRDQSSLAPELLTTLAQRAMSARK